VLGESDVSVYSVVGALTVATASPADEEFNARYIRYLEAPVKASHVTFMLDSDNALAEIPVTVGAVRVVA
jgi:hypothetical protein